VTTENKPFLNIQCKLLAIAQAQNDTIRNCKGIRGLLRVLKSVMTSKDPITNVEQDLLRTLCVLFASLTITRKNVEYIMIKRGE